MKPITKARFAALFCALAFAAAAATQTSAQTGAPVDDAAITHPLSSATMQSLFPLTGPSGLPGAMPAPQAQGGIDNIGKRFREEEVEAPRRESRTLIGLGNKHLWAIFGGMGFGAGFGGGIQITSADSIPGVELYTSAIVTTRKYRQFDIGAYIPKLSNEEGTHAEVRFRYQRRVQDNFFGIGPDQDAVFVTDFGPGAPFASRFGTSIAPLSSEGYETNYDLEQRQLSGVVEHRFNDVVQVGVYADATSSSFYEGDDDGDPSIYSLFTPSRYAVAVVLPTGEDRVLLPAPGMLGSKIFTYGGYVEADGRNTEDGLTKGYYLYGRFASADGFGDDDVDDVRVFYPGFATPFAPGLTTEVFGDFRDFGWIEAEMDARAYIPLGTDRLVWANRYYSELKNPKGNSVIPIYNLARLGSGGTLRGFDTFRFHANNSILFQTELRATVRMIENDPQKGIDVYGLFDAGQVWGILTGEPDDLPGNSFDSDNWEVDAGGGVAIRFKDFNFRFETAASNETTKFRLVFGTGF